MKIITTKILTFLTLCVPFAVNADTLTIEADLDVESSLSSGQSVMRRSSGGENVYFKWNERIPFAEVTTGNTSVANQAIYVEFDDVAVWGAITVTLVGDWHAGKTTGMIRKTFAIGRNSGWTNGNDGEQLEVAVGPIVDRYKLGSASSETGKLRLPIYKLADTRNRVTVFVEGHLSLDNPSANMDPATDISLSSWEVVAEDHIAERLVVDAESVTADGVILNPLSDLSQISTPGAIRYDSTSNDFEGYVAGDGWLSLTEAEGATALVDSSGATVLSVDANGALVLSDTTAGYLQAQLLDPGFGTSLVARNPSYIVDVTGANAVAGFVSTSFGYGNDVDGSNSMAWGASNTITELAYDATLWGNSNTASAWLATAWGISNTASGEYSTAFGITTIASGDSSTAWGGWTRAESIHSTALGYLNIGGGSPDVVNEEDPLLEVGNGASETERSNALTILKNGQTTLSNKGWTALSDPLDTPTDVNLSGGEALVVEGHARFRGKIELEVAQGDISMGAFGVPAAE